MLSILVNNEIYVRFAVVCMCLHVCVCVYMCVCVHVCVCDSNKEDIYSKWNIGGT